MQPSSSLSPALCCTCAPPPAPPPTYSAQSPRDKLHDTPTDRRQMKKGLKCFAPPFTQRRHSLARTLQSVAHAHTQTHIQAKSPTPPVIAADTYKSAECRDTNFAQLLKHYALIAAENHFSLPHMHTRELGHFSQSDGRVSFGANQYILRHFNTLLLYKCMYCCILYLGIRIIKLFNFFEMLDA
jgi:hypothetical protein